MPKPILQLTTFFVLTSQGVAELLQMQFFKDRTLEYCTIR